jgi:hypothetical protein
MAHGHGMAMGMAMGRGGLLIFFVLNVVDPH